jgi:hypothetical protein
MQLNQCSFDFFHLGFPSFDGLFQRAIVSQPKLDQLLLKPGGLILLSLQFILVLEGKLFLLTWKPK